MLRIERLVIGLVVAVFFFAFGGEAFAQDNGQGRGTGGGVQAAGAGGGCEAFAFGGETAAVGGGGCGGDIIPPDIILLSPSQVYAQYAEVKIGFCDANAMNSATRVVKVNGVVQTGQFDYAIPNPPFSGECIGSTQRTTKTNYNGATQVSLNVGSNTIQATICDFAPNCKTETFFVTRLSGAAPTIASFDGNHDVQDYGSCAFNCFAVT